MTIALFNYAIGFRWDESDPDSEVGLYSYGTDHWHGDMASAKNTLAYIKNVAGEDYHRVLRIYKLVEM